MTDLLICPAALLVSILAAAAMHAAERAERTRRETAERLASLADQWADQEGETAYRAHFTDAGAQFRAHVRKETK
jgi:hypothetical protein